MNPAPEHEVALGVLLEGLPDAAVGAGPDGLIVFVNGLAVSQFGYRRDELVGQPIEVLWPEHLRARYRRNFQLYFELEHPLRFSDKAFGLRKDGSEFIGEMSWGIVESDKGPVLLAIGRPTSSSRRWPNCDTASPLTKTIRPSGPAPTAASGSPSSRTASATW